MPPDDPPNVIVLPAPMALAVPLGATELIERVPALMVRAPENELTPESVSVPAPSFVRLRVPPVSLMMPDKMRL